MVHHPSPGLRTSAAARAAQNFTMPALSPTMTEGNIAAWRVKEGDKFSAGDVLLEIETDKATMDVEAQEDGILMKIMQNDGAKGVQVGTRIAVLAEDGDDVGALDLPPDESSAAPKKEAAVPNSVKAEPNPPVSEQDRLPSSRPVPAKSGAKAAPQTKPLLPSVARLMGENGLDASAVEDMTPTGPNGRLLKGDVLVYLGKIKASTPADIRERFQKNSCLDLGDIKLAVRREVNEGFDTRAGKEQAAEAAVPKDTQVSVPVLLARAVRVQKKIQKTLGVFLPLSTLIGRAIELANDELPCSAGAAPSADELFDQVLGLDKGKGTMVSRGHYLPQIFALPPTSLLTPRPTQTRRADIIDVLAGTWRKPAAPKPVTSLAPGISPTTQNLFSLTVPPSEEKRAKVFLQRVKLILEAGPERLVL